MNPRSDTDGLLRHWFEDGPTTMPDRVVDVVADRIGRQAQRRSWRLRRRPFMNTYVKVAAGLAATVIIALAAWQLLPRNSSIGGTPTPAPTATPPATPVSAWPWWVPAEDRGRDCGAGPGNGGLPRGCARELSAGTHQSVGLTPSLRFTVPAGWINTAAWPDWWILIPDSPVTRGGREQQILVAPDFAVLESSCEDVPAADTTPTAAALVAAIEAASGVDTSVPSAITVGALSGQSLDVRLSHGWLESCPEDTTRATAPVLGFRVHEGARHRFIALDAPGGRNILIMLSAADQPAFDEFADMATSIVDSFEFDFGPASS